MQARLNVGTCPSGRGDRTRTTTATYLPTSCYKKNDRVSVITHFFGSLSENPFSTIRPSRIIGKIVSDHRELKYNIRYVIIYNVRDLYTAHATLEINLYYEHVVYYNIILHTRRGALHRAAVAN